MSKRDDIELLVRESTCPSGIANTLDLPIVVVIDELWKSVGKGSLKPADIYLSFDSEQVLVLKEAVKGVSNGESIDNTILQSQCLQVEEVELFGNLVTKQVIGTEMYEYISEIETAIHQFVKSLLVSNYGSGEDGWWRHGIPVEIRKKCHSRREEDDDPLESPFAYLDLIDLSKIIGENWSLFKDRLVPVYRDNRKSLVSDFVRLNKTRNAVMHPVKQKHWTEDDYKFIRQFRERFWNLD